MTPTNLEELRTLLRAKGYKFQHDGPDYMTIEFSTGYVLSIGWGDLNYCSGRLRFLGMTTSHLVFEELDPTDAELAVWRTDNEEFIQFEGWTNVTKGWVQIPEILRIVAYLAGEPVDVSNYVHTL